MSKCSCIFNGYDSDGPFCSKQVERKARKVHKCIECHRNIEIGEKYNYESGIWNGEPESYKTCHDCLCVRNEFFCDGWIYGDIWYAVWIHITQVRGEISSDCINQLTPVSKSKIIDLIDKYYAVCCDD